MTPIFIVLTLAALFLFYYKKKANRKLTKSSGDASVSRQQSRLQTMISSGKYWGIYIDYVNEDRCCSPVLQLNKKQFPVNSVPVLPLEGCTKHPCQCTHAGLVEKRKLNANGQQRRKHHDRRDAIRFQEITDRRSHSDRRSNMWFHREK